MPHDRLLNRCWSEWKRADARAVNGVTKAERQAWREKATRWAALFDRVHDHQQGKHLRSRQTAAA